MEIYWVTFGKLVTLLVQELKKQECIPVGCIPPVCCPYLLYLSGVYLLGGCTCWRCTFHWGCTCMGAYLAGVGGVPSREGCTCPLGGVPAQGVYLLGWVSLLGGVLAGDCTCPVLGERVYLPRYSLTVNRSTDRCKNITLPQTSFGGGKHVNKLICSQYLDSHFCEHSFWTNDVTNFPRL